MTDRELTGNHYLSFPAIERDGAAIPYVTALHSALAGLLEWQGDPLLECDIRIDGERQPLAGLQWERVDRWIPQARARLTADCELTLTVCAPGGYDPLIRGAFIDIDLRSTSARERQVTAALDVHWQAARLHVRSARPLPGARRIVGSPHVNGLALEVGQVPFGAALAFVAGDSAARASAGKEGAPLRPLDGEAEAVAEAGEALVGRLEQSAALPAKRRVHFTFFLGLGRDRDSALATAHQLRRMGQEGLLRRGRFALSQLVRRSEDTGLTELLNRNLLFNHFFAVGRGLDDDRLHAIASRSPLHGLGASFNERDALLWTLPALTLNDPLLARELLMRAFEAFSGAPAQPARYLDGGILEPGFVLDQLLAYPLALARYAREAEDATAVEDPVVQDVLREIDAALYDRLHQDVLLAETELLDAREAADFPYPTFGNVLLWAYSRAVPEIWRREEGEPPASFEGSADELAATIWQRCTVEVEGMPVLVSSTNLHGQAAVYDDPSASLALLPYLGFCEPTDPIWRNTMELLRSGAYPLWHGTAPFPGTAARATPATASLAGLCSELLGPGRERALRTLRSLQLADGVASEQYDPQTGLTAGGAHAAALAGFLAWALDRGAPAPKRRRRR